MGFDPIILIKSDLLNLGQISFLGRILILGLFQTISTQYLNQKLCTKIQTIGQFVNYAKRLVTSVGFVTNDMIRTPNGNLLIKASSRPTPHNLILQAKMNISGFWIRMLQIM
jgi:hypothetical protein